MLGGSRYDVRSSAYASFTLTSEVAITIETANTPHAVAGFEEGLDNGAWTYVAGVTKSISAYADYSGTVAGTVKATTTTAHTLSTGDWITIRGTTNYNGVFQVTVIDDDEFYFTDTWVADDGASDLERGTYFLANGSSGGTYLLCGNASVSEGGAAGSTVQFKVYVNGTEQVVCRTSRKFANNDEGNASGGGIIEITTGDIVWGAIQSTGTNTLTFKSANLRWHRI